MKSTELLFKTPVLLLCLALGWASRLDRTELAMPNVLPKAEDSYLCTSLSLDQEREHYILEFEPHASKDTAHHMIVFGCAEPGSDEKAWDCGEMNGAGTSGYSRGSVCAQGSQTQILWAWAKDKPDLALKLPKGVGFKVGGDTPIQYLVVQIHYMMPLKKPDDSGIVLKSTTDRMPKTAATLLMVTGGEIRAHSTENFETACLIDEDVELHPISFRTHTHGHGKVVSGWKIQKNGDKDKWQLIGKEDPQKPQMFYPVKDNKMVIGKGDVVAARCKMENDEDRDIPVGATRADEMCNFYMMYWVEGDNILSDNTCFSPGPPNYYWEKDGGLTDIPKDAGTL